jgi:hypothetical protein
LIRAADPLSLKLAQIMPNRVSRVFGLYGEWLSSIQPQGEGARLAAMIRKILLQVGVNLALVMAIFFAGGYFAPRIAVYLAGVGDEIELAARLDLGRRVIAVVAVSDRGVSQTQGTVDALGRDGG